MKERPILFSAPMVRAILEDRKTMTRRVAKLANFGTAGERQNVKCPYGQPGDRLWVRETFYAYGRWETLFNQKKGREEWRFVDMTLECGFAYQYAADNPDITLAKGRGVITPGWHKRPAIHMPRRACRSVVEIVSVRVERLRDISETDARAEGVTLGGPIGHLPTYQAAPYAYHYAQLWESINGAGSWDANPWVWVIEFKRIDAK